VLQKNQKEGKTERRRAIGDQSESSESLETSGGGRREAREKKGAVLSRKNGVKEEHKHSWGGPKVTARANI